jgi:hypothetical protein
MSQSGTKPRRFLHTRFCTVNHRSTSPKLSWRNDLKIPKLIFGCLFLGAFQILRVLSPFFWELLKHS